MSIGKCGCVADSKGNARAAQFQDLVYGAGNRVHTETQQGNKVRCTVCGKDKPASK